MSVGSAQRLVDHAVQLYEAAGRPLPRSLETLAQDVHSLDVRLSYDLSKALSGLDEVGARAHYQRTLGERSQGAASEQKRHQGAGAALSTGGLYFRSDLDAKLAQHQAASAPSGSTSEPAAPPPAPKKERFDPGFTPFNLTPRQRALHEAKVSQLAELAKTATREKLTPAQQAARLEEIKQQAEDARLAASDVDSARAERQAKLDALPWILRTLLESMQGWADFGKATANGEKAERPSLIGRLVKSAYSGGEPPK